MSSYASLYVLGREIFTWRNEIDPTFLFVFTQDNIERVQRPLDDVAFDGDEVQTLLSTDATTLSDRLDILGIGRTAVVELFDLLIEQEAERVSHRSFGDSADHKLEEEFLVKLTLADWIDLVTRALQERNEGRPFVWKEPPTLGYLLSLWEGTDPRYFLRAILFACGPSDIVKMDVTDLIQGGWIDEDFEPQSAAIEYFGYALANGSPAVIITEGSTDWHFIEASIGIRFPHLASFIRFYDFDSGVEGSAGAAVRTLKSFIAAGITNRVVLLLDNDTAAKDAVRNLDRQSMPAYYKVVHYPDLEIANDYPTLGPTGLTRMNVNGLAGSIEMYLGREVLIDDGQLIPVQWRAYVEGAQAYQGELMSKRLIQRRFKDKLRLAKSNPSAMEDQDWEGIDAIVKHLMKILSE